MKNRRGVVVAGLALYLVIAGVAGWVAIEGRKVFSPNTHKKEVVVIDSQAQAIAREAADAQAKLAVDIAANKAALTAQQNQIHALQLVAQDAAGFVSGASTALSGEDSPTVGQKVAAILISDAANTLPPATSAQVKAYQLIVAQMKADNARLSAALLVKEQEAASAKALALKSQGEAMVAINKAAISDQEAKLAAVTVTTQAAHHAETVSKLDAKVSDSITLLGRIKAFGIGGSLFLFVLLPLLAMAFPALAPVIRGITAPLLKLWHTIHEREVAYFASLHADTKGRLEAEQAAHTETKAMLVKVATAP